MKKLVVNMSLIFISVAIFFNCSGQSTSKSVIYSRLDSLLISAYNDDEPGASVLVALDEKILIEKGYGLSDTEREIPTSKESVFAAGSITKQFTAMAILLLEEQGRLRVDDNVTEYIGGLPEEFESITIDHLMSHTSGIIDLFEIPEFFSLWQSTVTPNQIIDLFKEKPLLAPAGSLYHYSNANYALLAGIIEQVTDSPYEIFIEKEFFGPLGMTNSSIPVSGEIVEGLVKGYYDNNEGFSPAETIDYSILYGAGGLFTTTEDLFKWYSWLTYLYKKGDPKVLKTVNQFTLNDGTVSNNGYGMLRYDLAGELAIGNNGSMVGYNAYTLWMPEKEIIVILLTNRSSQGYKGTLRPGSDIINLSKNIALISLGKALPETNTSSKEHINMPDSLLDKYAGMYEVEKGVFRIVSRKGNTLYRARSDQGTRKPLFALSDTLFEDSDGTRLIFVLDRSGRAVQANWVKEDGTISIGQLTNLPVPEPKIMVKLPREKLEAVCGRYKMMVVFNVDVYMASDSSIIIESKQQGKSEFYPESESRFFSENDDSIVIDFEKDRRGVINSFKMTTLKNVFNAKRE